MRFSAKNSGGGTKSVVYETTEDFLAEKTAFNEFDFVINTAFSQLLNPAVIAESIMSNTQIFRKLKDIKVKNVVNISTQSVYGMYRENPTDENGTIRPDNVYALGKYATEEIGNAIFENTNINYTNIRLGSLYGVEYTDRVVNKLIKFAKTSNSMNVENGKQQFGYLHVEDAAKAIVSFIDLNIEKYENVYNLGSANDGDLTLSEIARFIKEEMSKNGCKVSLDEKSSPRKTLMDSNKFMKLTSWQPKRTLKDFITEQILN